MSDCNVILSDIAGTAQAATHGWVPLEYETMDGIQGTMVYAPATRILPELRIPLPVKGRYRIHLGLAASVPGSQQVTMGIRAKLERDPAFGRIIGWGVNWWWEMSENYWKSADLDHDTLVVANAPGMESGLAWVRLECIAAEQPAPLRTMVTTNDGYAPYRSLEELYETFMPFADSPVKKIFFCVGHGDVAHVASAVATVPEYSETEYYNREYDRDCVIRLGDLRRQYPDLVGRLADFVHKLGMEFHVSFRTGCMYMPGWPAMVSRFYIDHPELRCRHLDGGTVARLSYAAPPVQEHFLAFYREALQYDIDGLNLIWIRALPAMLFEEAFMAPFEREYGARPVRADDPRVLPFREKLMTGWLRRVRALLDQTGAARGRRLELSLTVPATEAVNREHGLNPAALARAGLADLFLVDGSLQVRSHEERLANIDLDYFRQACAETACGFLPKMSDATFDDAFVGYYRNAMARGAAGVFLWDGTASWRSWNNIRQLTDRDGSRAQEWYNLHTPEMQTHLLKSLDGVDMDHYPPHVAY